MPRPSRSLPARSSTDDDTGFTLAASSFAGPMTDNNLLALALLIGIPALGSCIGIGLWFATANRFR